MNESKSRLRRSAAFCPARAGRPGRQLRPDECREADRGPEPEAPGVVPEIGHQDQPDDEHRRHADAVVQRDERVDFAALASMDGGGEFINAAGSMIALGRHGSSLAPPVSPRTRPPPPRRPVWLPRSCAARAPSKGNSMKASEAMEDALSLLAPTGPEYAGKLANHGPDGGAGARGSRQTRCGRALGRDLQETPARASRRNAADRSGSVARGPRRQRPRRRLDRASSAASSRSVPGRSCSRSGPHASLRESSRRLSTARSARPTRCAASSSRRRLCRHGPIVGELSRVLGPRGCEERERVLHRFSPSWHFPSGDSTRRELAAPHTPPRRRRPRSRVRKTRQQEKPLMAPERDGGRAVGDRLPARRTWGRSRREVHPLVSLDYRVRAQRKCLDRRAGPALLFLELPPGASGSGDRLHGTHLADG